MERKEEKSPENPNATPHAPDEPAGPSTPMTPPSSTTLSQTPAAGDATDPEPPLQAEGPAETTMLQSATHPPSENSKNFGQPVPPSLTLGPHDPKNPGLTIPATTAPALKIPKTASPDGQSNDTEIVSSDDNNPNNDPNNKDPEKDTMGPTWLDALLYAIKHSVQLNHVIARKIGVENLKAQQAGSSLEKELLKRFKDELGLIAKNFPLKPKQLIQDAAMVLEALDQAGPEALENAGLDPEVVNEHSTTLKTLSENSEALKNAVTTLANPNAQEVHTLQQEAAAVAPQDAFAPAPTDLPAAEITTPIAAPSHTSSEPKSPRIGSRVNPEPQSPREKDNTREPYASPRPEMQRGHTEPEESPRASNKVPDPNSAADTPNPNAWLLAAVQQEATDLHRNPVEKTPETEQFTANQPPHEPQDAFTPEYKLSVKKMVAAYEIAHPPQNTQTTVQLKAGANTTTVSEPQVPPDTARTNPSSPGRP